MLAKEVVLNDRDGETGWSNLVLSSSVHNTILGPVNGFRGDGSCHVAGKNLVFGHLFKE